MNQKLCIPEKVLEQHAIWLGKTRAGKSSSMRHVVEWLLEHKQRLCIVDPKGDWYGLKLSADGKSGGYPVILFGDFKEASASDVPINDRSGKHIAELIASGNRPCVIGMRGWSNAAQSRFWIDFASTLFNSNLAGGLKLFVDEVQNFGPKERTGIGQENEALGWTKRLLSEGSGLGLTVFCGSQRPASVHNGVLTQCETLVAMRVIHASDRQAAELWIKGCGDTAIGGTVLNSLAALKRGEAFVWSPEAEFGPERVQFPMFGTFDSFAPPQLQKKISAAGWSTVNLDDVKAKLATVIEEAKANDPAMLKAEVRRLNAELKKAQKNAERGAGSGEQKEVIKEVPVLTKEEAILLERVGTCLETAIAKHDDVLKFLVRANDLQEELKSKFARIQLPPPHLPSRPVLHFERFKKPLPSPAEKNVRAPQNGSSVTLALPKAERKILAVLANYPDGKSKREVGVIAGYKHSGGGFNNAVGALRSMGFVTAGDPLRITEEGLAANGPVQPLPTGDELFEYWMNHPELGKAEREILRVLVKEVPEEAWTKEQIAPLTVSDRGTPYEANGGGFNNAIGRLRTYELIEGKGQLRAVEQFFQ